MLQLRAIYLNSFQAVRIYTMFYVACPSRDIFSDYSPTPSMVSVDGAFLPFYTDQAPIYTFVGF